MMLIPGLVLGALWIPSVPLILFSSIDWYLKALDESPLLTKSVTAGLIQFMGDYAAQCYEGKKNTKIFGSPDNHASDRRAHFWWPTKHYSMRRGLSLFVDGLVLSGPLMHYSYQWMEQVLPTGTGDWKAIVCHVLIDDYIIDNLYIALSFVFTGVSEGHGKDLSSIFRKDYWATMTASLCTNLVLVPVEYFCFGYLSIQFRTLFMNFVDLLWGAIISFMSHRSRRKEAAAVSWGVLMLYWDVNVVLGDDWIGEPWYVVSSCWQQWCRKRHFYQPAIDAKAGVDFWRHIGDKKFMSW
jgi:hypothetical protein